MIRTIDDILTMDFHGNMVQDYLLAFFVTLLIFLGLIFLFSLFKKVLRKLDERNPEKQLFSRKIVEVFSWPLFLVVGLSIASASLQRTEVLSSILTGLLVVIITVYVAKIIVKIINFSANKFIERSKNREDATDPALIEIYAKLLSILTWVLVGVLLLVYFNVNLTTIFAGLGVASVVIAFALQNVLADLFASVSIYFDKPFSKGDFIVTGEDMGFVQKIGIKSTRIKTLNGEELVVSNRELTETRVRNFRHMERRRVALNIGVQYDTPLDKLKKIPSIIEKILSKIDDAELSRAHFKSFKDFSLEFEAVYFIKNKDYQLFMDIQQKVNLEVVKAFRKEGIVFALPTKTVHLFQEKKKKRSA